MTTQDVTPNTPSPALPAAPRIGIIGSGALGLFYGARLAQGGADVHFLLRRDYEAVRRDGLHVQSIDGDFSLHPPVYPHAQALGRCDLLLIGLKSTDNDALPALLAPTAGPQTLVLTLQNGLGNEERIAEILAAQSGQSLEQARRRVLGGTAFLCSNRIGPGRIDHSAHGWVRLAELEGPAQARTQAIAGLFRAGEITCEVYDALLQARWEKLVWNIPFNGLSVAARLHDRQGADTQIVLQSEPLTLAARGLMEEVIAAARADGVTIAPEFIGKMMDSTTCMGAYKTSMQLDWEAGRPLEVEAILGEPWRRAHRAGIATPRLELLYGIARQAQR